MMKKTTLAILLAATTAGAAFIANADTKNNNFGDLSAKADEGRMELPNGEQVKSQAPQFGKAERNGFIDAKGEAKNGKRPEGQNAKFDGKRGQERGPEKGEGRPEMSRGEAKMGGMPPMGGFVSSKEASKVSDTDKWQDDQFVLLEGNIVKQVGKKDYVFKDSSGELTLEIDRQAWRGLINPEDKVRIVADVEKSWGKTEVEAISVENADKPQPPMGQPQGQPKMGGQPPMADALQGQMPQGQAPQSDATQKPAAPKAE